MYTITRKCEACGATHSYQYAPIHPNAGRIDWLQVSIGGLKDDDSRDACSSKCAFDIVSSCLSELKNKIELGSRSVSITVQEIAIPSDPRAGDAAPAL